jgi:hypothetical protein
MAHIVRHWADWISATTLSQWLQGHPWVVPTSQSIHILMISVVFGCAVMINLRLLGVSAGGRSISTLVGTLVPWMYIALVLLLITGAIQTITEPVRQFVTPAFWWKMLMIVVVVSLTQWFASSVRRNAARWDTPARGPGARVFALVSLALWIAIIYCGRFIAYTWEFHL